MFLMICQNLKILWHFCNFLLTQDHMWLEMLLLLLFLTDPSQTLWSVLPDTLSINNSWFLQVWENRENEFGHAGKSQGICLQREAREFFSQRASAIVFIKQNSSGLYDQHAKSYCRPFTMCQFPQIELKYFELKLIHIQMTQMTFHGVDLFLTVKFYKWHKTVNLLMFMGINICIFETKPCSQGLILAVSSGLVHFLGTQTMIAGIYFCDLKVVTKITE